MGGEEAGPRRREDVSSVSGGREASYVQVTTATDSEEEARRIARTSVEARLAACGQVLGPITSTYWWRGTVETETEWLCLLKAPASRFERLAAHVRAEHSYETPEITATPISLGSADYLAWIDEEATG
jgi:periplasmic divalent cation tolerance protein